MFTARRFPKALAFLSSLALVASGVGIGAATARAEAKILRAALEDDAIRHIIVIDMENENFADTFGPASPATYLNGTLRAQGELIPNYYATSHVSLGNYIAQVSGQAPTQAINNDCLDLSTLVPPFNNLKGLFTNIVPGIDAVDSLAFPGQVVGDGCVFPAPTVNSHAARTIADQLDAIKRPNRKTSVASWRMYAEDMGDDIARDYGTPDASGGADCAHPPIGGVDNSNSAAATDQYATRHNPFMYFHSVIDRTAVCNANVVPLGKVTIGLNGQPDVFAGHLAQDLQREATTPNFAFISPNLCTDGHDATCRGPNTEGTHAGGLVALDLWLKHWMPLIFASPAYYSGKTLVVLTFDEANPTGATADSRACCNERPGANVSNSGFSPVLAIFHAQTTPLPGTFPYPGGGQVGAVLFNPRYILPGSVNITGFYNHYSALRSYEDLLGIEDGGDDGYGHLGFASDPGLVPFGHDVFNAAYED
jgi:phosphatidylinositol-3-phosphatase